MSGIAISTEACIDVKDRACVDVCPVQCIYEFDPNNNMLFSEDEAGSGVIENSHRPNPDTIAVFGDSLLYVNTDECTSCYQPDVCPRRSDLFRRGCPRWNLSKGLQPRRSQQEPRPYVLHPAQPGCLRRLGSSTLDDLATGRDDVELATVPPARGRCGKGGP